jgi:hypothetical protein
VDEHEHGAAEIAQGRRDEGAQDDQRLGTDDGVEPGAVYHIGAEVGVQEGEDGKAEVNQRDPDEQSEQPQV